MRILIVEDEPKMASYLRKGLTEASYTVDVAENGQDGLFLALHEDFDLIVLDVMLPALDGFEVLRRLRAQKQTPVLLLTAREAIEDKVAGLDSAPTITCSSRSRMPNSSRASARCCGARHVTCATSCTSPISKSTCSSVACGARTLAST